MDFRPPNLPLLLFLTSLLPFWKCTRGQSSYTIDAVGLTILPSSTVQSGTPVRIRCQVSVSHDNIPDLKHTFQLSRDDAVVYSSTTTEDKVIYELSPARAADSGNYECRVTVKEKSKTSFGQKLDVTGLQTPSLYLNKTEPYRSEEFTAICSAPEEKGSLTFRFYQRYINGEPQKIKQLASTGNSSETTLVLRVVGNSFLYCDYEIILVSGPRRSNRSREISVIVKELHIFPIMNVLPSLEVFEGDILEVVCRVISPPKNTEVFLTKDRRILKQAAVSLNHRFTAKEGDSGELVCKAEWGNVQKETYKTITVKELFSKPRLTVTPTDIYEGERFMVVCSVSIYVPERLKNGTLQFSIYKDNVKLISLDTFIDVAHPLKNGNYSCKVHATSLQHSFLKESQTVVVKAKVPVSKPVLSVVGAELVLGKGFQLLCHSVNGTLPIVYTLYCPNKQVETQVVSKQGEEAIFNCSAIYRINDVNNILCRARNSQEKVVITDGRQLLQSTNIIEPVSQPVLHIISSTGDISEGQNVSLVCSVKRGSFPITFTWYRIDREGSLTSQTSWKLEESYKITNIRQERNGGYYCTSTNPAEVTEKSHTITIIVKLAGWKKALIAVFCVLLILLLILVIILKSRNLPLFKKKKSGELSVKPVSIKAERLSLTQAEVNEAANVTPGMIGKSVWSEHVSGSESDDQNSVTSPEESETQYAEVQTRPADPNRAPVQKGTDTEYSEVRNSRQGAAEQADGQASVEYAQLNHDANEPGGHSVQDEHSDETDNTADNA